MNFIKIPLTALIIFLISNISDPVLAHDYSIGNLTISHPWARATSGTAKSGAAYMLITNNGDHSDSLIGVSSPIAKKTNVHSTIIEDGIMKMRPVDAIYIPPDSVIDLEPGGLHVMFMGLKQSLNEGDKIPLVLKFESAGDIDIMVYVDEAGAMGEMDMGNSEGN